MRLLIAVIFANIVVCNPAYSNDSDGASCAKIDDGSERLICYDSIFRLKTELITNTESSSLWRVRTEKSRIADTKDVFMNLSSNDTIKGRFGGEKKASLIVRCEENSTSVYFILGDQYLADIQGYGDITFRLDSEKAITKGFEASTDNKALGLWRDSDAIPFIKNMVGIDNMIVRVTPYNQSPITVDFPVKGLDGAIKPLREACRW